MIIAAVAAKENLEEMPVKKSMVIRRDIEKFKRLFTNARSQPPQLDATDE